MFDKILIANRGEIAVRVARTAKAMGIQTVAVFSDADRDAPHVEACDEAIHIGPAPAAESYLVMERIIAAAQRTGAQAVHPGYGFLSENETFANALDEAGIVFIGPTAATIRAMGSKSAAKDLMEKAGVPTTPGYQGADQSVSTFKAEAERIGYPVLLKATAGGGGKGMRMVERADDLEEALAAAQREALSAFGDDRFLIEKYVARARHLEVQVFGDGRGNVVHLYERDCSVQRRHQKIIEEAPAPNLNPAVRDRLHRAGVDAAKAVAYRGAGTVEFLYDPAAGEDGVYFMEMNTRLQVEHPVSEMITGLDFVEWQLRIAAGEPLPLDQADITATGHAFEARLYAEKPVEDFAPSVGELTTLRLPDQLARVDSGVREGQTVTPYYDPMIAKIITHGPDRAAALGCLRAALAQTDVVGPETNTAFLYRLAADDAFNAGDVSTKYIAEHGDTLFAETGPSAAQAILCVADQVARRSGTGLRLHHPHTAGFWIDWEGAPGWVALTQAPDGRLSITVTTGTDAVARREGVSSAIVLDIVGTVQPTAQGEWAVTYDGHTAQLRTATAAGGIRVFGHGGGRDILWADPMAGQSQGNAHGGSLKAPMPGVVTQIIAAADETVAAGAALLVMEAMKMEHTIKAPYDGIVRAQRFSAGDQVSEGDLLIDFEETS